MQKKKEIVVSGYNKIAADYDKGRKMKLDGLLIRKFASSLPEKALVLDVGCGSGKVARVLTSKGIDVIGIDISDSMLCIARKNAPLAKFLKQSMDEIDFNRNSFDGIVCLYSLIHVPRKKHAKILRILHRILKPGGILLITMGWEDLENSVELFHGALMYWSHFSREENLKLLQKVGLKVKGKWKIGSSSETHLFVLAVK